MDIKILDSHLREQLETNAKPMDIAKALSLSSASIERVEPFGKDWVYSVEVTTNRPDMLSVKGLAREAATVLPQFGYNAKLLPIKLAHPKKDTKDSVEIHVVNNDKLVRRICGIVLDVDKKESPQFVKDSLEAAGIRSLNNLVDITNYVMLEIGHPCHVFDYDRLKNHTLIIRESKKGEKIITLDKKEHMLSGGDIVADNGEGEIIDLLGIMGTANSVVTDNTKHILFFFDNNDPWRIRKTSMGLAIRTDAAALNEKGVDPELAMEALERGVALYKELAGAKVMSDVIDIYPGKVKSTTITVNNDDICRTIGVTIPIRQSDKILKSLGFEVEQKNGSLMVKVPSWRELDVTIPEDVIEEVARMYGYHNIPTELPPFKHAKFYHQSTNQFFWEQKAKEALKYWGLTEVYTYSTVSETMFEGPLDEAVTLANPLDVDHTYLRKTLTPSLLAVIAENKSFENVAIFEIANVYRKNKTNKLPTEIRTLGIVLKGKEGDFYHAKGLIEQLLSDIGITNPLWKDSDMGGIGAALYLDKVHVGDIEVMDKGLVTAELNFEETIKLATLKKTYTPLAKYPAITEDISFVLPQEIKTGDVIEEIQKQSTLIKEVSLLDIFEQTRTFHILYQSKERNLTTEEVGEIRKKIIGSVEMKFKGKVK
ncbi:MAG TPA: phenylalanine--tRNA ligase subunit beta [Candidatus Saccharimonadales bacterium]|nr:phenylalanine--tRNA ligase subunit beta [Candidatus Saccharimonadales bacterium]